MGNSSIHFIVVYLVINSRVYIFQAGREEDKEKYLVQALDVDLSCDVLKKIMREAAVVGLTGFMEVILARGDAEVFLQGEDGAPLIQTFLKHKKCAIVIALLKNEK